MEETFVEHLWQGSKGVAGRSRKAVVSAAECRVSGGRRAKCRVSIAPPVSAILGIAVGIVLLLWPLSGVLSLTLILIMFFVIEGVASIMFALEHKRELSGRWSWMLASGIVDLILATFIFAGLPGTAAWAIGLLVGINMLFGGSALIAMALHAREIDPRSAAPAR